MGFPDPSTNRVLSPKRNSPTPRPTRGCTDWSARTWVTQPQAKARSRGVLAELTRARVNSPLLTRCARSERKRYPPGKYPRSGPKAPCWKALMQVGLKGSKGASHGCSCQRSRTRSAMTRCSVTLGMGSVLRGSSVGGQEQSARFGPSDRRNIRSHVGRGGDGCVSSSYRYLTPSR